MSKYIINIDGVAPAGVRQTIAPGTWRGRITSHALEEDTKYGNAVRFNVVINEPSTDEHNKRNDFLLWVPDETMAAETEKVAKKENKKSTWASNFISLMQGKWVALIQAAGFKPSGDMDIRKVAKKIEGEEMLFIVQEDKNNKPGDDFTNINGFMPLPDDYAGADGADEVELPSDDDDDGDDDFDLDAI